MRRYVKIDGDALFFSFLEGEVMSVNKHSTSDITGRGGGGYISTDAWRNVRGKIDDIHISTKINTELEIWIKSSDNTETRIAVKNTDIPCRQGHRVAFVIIENYLKNIIAVFINFNAKDVKKLIPEKDLLEIFKIKDAPVKSKKVGKVAAVTAFAGFTIAGIVAAAAAKSVGPMAFGVIAGLLAFSTLVKKVEIQPEKDNIQNSALFMTEYENAIRWAMKNLYDPANADIAYLTPPSQIPQKTQAQIEAERVELKEKRKREGRCTVCGGELVSQTESIVGYCNNCKNE